MYFQRHGETTKKLREEGNHSCCYWVGKKYECAPDRCTPTAGKIKKPITCPFATKLNRREETVFLHDSLRERQRKLFEVENILLLISCDVNFLHFKTWKMETRERCMRDNGKRYQLNEEAFPVWHVSPGFPFQVFHPFFLSEKGQAWTVGTGATEWVRRLKQNTRQHLPPWKASSFNSQTTSLLGRMPARDWKTLKKMNINWKFYTT